MRVLLIENNVDHATIISHRLSGVLSDRDECAEVRVESGEHRAVDEAESYDPDLILMDYRLGETDGVTLLCQMRDRGLYCPVILITGYGDEYLAADATRAGAEGYISKDDLQEDRFAEVINRVWDHLDDWRDRRQEVAETRALMSGITPREREVMDLILSGKTNKEIAESLFRSVQTVKIHRANLMHKMNAHTPADLARKVFSAEHGPALHDS